MAKKSPTPPPKPKKTFSDRLALIVLVGLVVFGSLTPVYRALTNVPYVGAYFYEMGNVVPNMHSEHFLVEEVDNVGYYSYLRSLAIDHDLNLENDFTLFGWPTMAKDRTAVGLTPNIWSVGPAILWTPAFLVAHLTSLALNALGNPVPTDGVSFVYDFFIVLSSMIYGLIGLVFIYFFLRFFFSPLQSFLALIFYFYASPLVFYQFHEPAMSHTMTVFAASGFLYFWYKNWLKKGLKDWFWLGIWAGVMALVRSQDIFLFIVPAAVETVALFRQKKKLELSLLAGPLLMLALAFVLFIPQMLAWKIIYGKFITVPQGPNFMHWSRPAFWETLFSTNHGLITYTPVMLICLIGLFFYQRKKPEQSLLCLVFGLILLLEYYVNSSVSDWVGGWAFGGRRFLSCSVIFAWGLANLFQATWANRKLLYTLIGLLVLLVVFNLLFYVQWVYVLIPKADVLTWRQYFAGKLDAFFLWLKIMRYLFSLAIGQ